MVCLMVRGCKKPIARVKSFWPCFIGIDNFKDLYGCMDLLN